MPRIRFIPSRPVLHAAVCSIVLVGVLAGWTAVQNEQYDSRLDAAYEPMITAIQRMPNGLEEKQAIVAKRLPASATSVQISKVTFEITFLPMQRADLTALRSVDPPPMWRAYHAALVDLQRARLAAFETQYQRLQYADHHLGERPSNERIAQLPTDPRYVELGQLVELKVDNANRLGRAFHRAVPVPAAWFPASPDVQDIAPMRVPSPPLEAAEDDPQQ